MCSNYFQVRVIAYFFAALSIETEEKVYTLIQDEYSSSMAKAVAYNIDNFFAKFASNLVFNAESRNKNAAYHQLDLINEILEKVVSQTIELDLYSEIKIKSLRYYNIFIVDSYESFSTIFNEINDKTYDFTGYYLIYYSHSGNDYYKTITKIFRDCWSKFIVNVNVIIEPVKNQIFLYTYFPYNFFHCGSVEPAIVNTFQEGKMLSDDLFPRKTTNLHRCPLSVITWQNPPYVYFEKFGDGPIRYRGIEGEIIEHLSRQMNFTIDLKIPKEQRGDLFLNGTATGAFKMMLNGEGNMTINNMRYSELRAHFLTATYTYYYSSVVISFASVENFTDIEQLLLPFAPNTWNAVLLTWAIIICVMCVLNLTNSVIRSFVVGKNVTNPFNNAINVCFGGTLNTTPTRNFARFLLIIWIMLTMILRNAYQGSLYDHLRSDKAKDPPKLIRDLINRGYVFRANLATYNFLSNFRTLHKSSEIMNGSFQQNFDEIINSGKKIAVISSKDFVTYYNNKNYRHGIMHILRERLYVQPYCIYLQKYSYLKDDINDKLVKFMSYGFTSKWTNRYVDEKFNVRRRTKEFREPKKFTIHHLKGIYHIYSLLLLISMGVFLLELIVNWLKKMINRRIHAEKRTQTYLM